MEKSKCEMVIDTFLIDLKNALEEEYKDPSVQKYQLLTQAAILKNMYLSLTAIPVIEI